MRYKKGDIIYCDIKANYFLVLGYTEVDYILYGSNRKDSFTVEFDVVESCCNLLTDAFREDL